MKLSGHLLILLKTSTVKCKSKKYFFSLTESFSFRAKLAEGLLTAKYAVEPVTDESTKDVIFEGIKPQMFKTLVGKGHPDFSSKRQQDAQEFFLHIVNLLEVK